MTDLSDPRGAGRRDRRAALRTIDDAYASRRISSVDRALRVEQVAAASTVGDLAMITRDLAAPAPAPAPPAPAAPVPTPPPWRPPAPAARPRPPRVLVGCLIAAAVVLLVVPVVLSIIVTLVAFTFGDGFESAPPAPLTSASDWTELVDGLESAAGTTDVRVATVEATSMEAEVLVADGVETWTYDGDWTAVAESPAAGAPSGPTVDLASLDPGTITSLTTRAGGEEADSTLRIAVESGLPTATVTVDEVTGTRTVRFTTTGAPLS